MVKVIIFCTKIIIVAALALLFTSCGTGIFNGIKGTGNVQKEMRTISEKFTKISVSRGIEVIVEQGNDVFVEVEADQNLLQHITTKVESGTLLVSSDENIYSADAETVHIKIPVIDALDTTSGSTIKSKSTLKGTNISVKSSSGSEIELALEYDTISCESTSGSSINLSGKALKSILETSSGSTISAAELLANDVIAQAASGSTIEVHPLVSLKAKASSGASINYDSNPKTVSKEENSGGSVSGN
jgi:hypothetical protein